MTEIVRATVTQVSPLRVRVDGATSSSAAQSLPGATFTANARVYAATTGSTLLVLSGDAPKVLGNLTSGYPDTTYTNSSLPTTYPDGASSVFGHGDQGWPAGYSVVTTVRFAVDATQLCQGIIDGRLYRRYTNGGLGNAWSAWTRLDRPAVADYAENANSLDGLDQSAFLRRPLLSTANNLDVNMPLIESGQSINRFFSTGIWNCTGNPTGTPSAFSDGRWYWLQVMPHVFGAHWARQIAYDMTGGSDTFYTRRCTGGDATLAGSWTAWVAK